MNTDSGTSKIHVLRGDFVPDHPVERVVDLLRGLLDRAEKGEVVAIACAIVDGGGTASTCWEQAGRMANELAVPIMVLSHRYATSLETGG